MAGTSPARDVDMMELGHAIGDKVVALFGGSAGHAGRRRQRFAAAMSGAAAFPAIAQVDAYWEALRRGRVMPARAEVDPRGLELALEYAFILEQIAPGLGRIRVAGMHLCDLLGMEVRGMPISAFFAPEARDRLSELMRAIGETPMVADLTLQSDGVIGRPPLVARLFLAPLAVGPGKSPRILGCLQSAGDIGRTPRRFTIASIHSRRIVATADAADAAQSPALRRDPQPGFAEPRADFAPAPKPTGRPTLRLVKSEQ